MTAIVLNTATGAVSEYDWTFQSLTASHAGNATSLLTLGGDTDKGAPITGQVITGKPGGEKMLTLGDVFLTLDGVGQGVLIVQGRTQSWEYDVLKRSSGIARAKPGRGIRESRLAFGYRNVSGAYFRLERIDAEVTQSTTRRV